MRAKEFTNFTYKTEPYEGWNGDGIVVRTYDGDTEVGHVIFEPTEDDNTQWYAVDVEVEEPYQRKGIATKMYDIAKKSAKQHGAIIVKSHAQTDAGRGLWQDKQVWEQINESKTTLNNMYGGHFPDRDEEFWDYVTPRELGQALTVETMQKHKVLIMLLSQYRAEHIDDITDMLDDDQQEIVQSYVNDPTLSSKTIVVANNKIIDGNHRALAAAIKGVPINYVDLAELDEEPIDEAELDSTGWGATPQGTDVDYFGLKVKMRPSTFLKLSHPLNSSEQNSDVEKHMQGGGKIAYPFLEIKDPVEWEDGDFSQQGKVVNHEGRNRMTHWIKMKGDEPIQVNVFLRGANRRRYVTNDMIQALSQGLISQTGQLVKNPFEGSTALDEEINPDCFNPAFNDTQEFDGLTYRATVEEEYGKPILVIKVLDDFQPVGLAKFKQSKDSVVSLISSFRPEYQGKGIARNVYAYVRMLGNTIQPSKNQLPPGKAMWQSWKKSGDAKHLMK